jgi:hypothetical protein
MTNKERNELLCIIVVGTMLWTAVVIVLLMELGVLK